MNANAATSPSPRAGRTPRTGAFTLIEIMVVVGIIGLTLTMGVPAFVRALHKEGMRKAESDLLEACQKARGGAIIHAQPQNLIIHPAERTFEAPGAFPATTLPDGVSIGSIVVNDVARRGRTRWSSFASFPKAPVTILELSSTPTGTGRNASSRWTR